MFHKQKTTFTIVKYGYKKILIRHTTLNFIVETQFQFPPLQNRLKLSQSLYRNWNDKSV